jgi:hypothetical protein
MTYPYKFHSPRLQSGHALWRKIPVAIGELFGNRLSETNSAFGENEWPETRSR